MCELRSIISKTCNCLNFLGQLFVNADIINCQIEFCGGKEGLKVKHGDIPRFSISFLTDMFGPRTVSLV